MKLVNCLFALCSLAASIALAGEGEFKNTLIEHESGSLYEKYDVFTEDNKEYSVSIKEAGKSWGKVITLRANQNSKAVEISTTIGRGDGRYSKRRSGSFKFKFDADDTSYHFQGSSYYLRSAYATISKESDSEFLSKLASKNYAYVKVDIAGSSHTFKIDLKGVSERLTAGKFLL